MDDKAMKHANCELTEPEVIRRAQDGYAASF
jgi:hypothetical protein